MNITDGMIKKICSSMIYRRGCEYFREGRIHMRKRANDEITAVVDGERIYNVRITFNDDKINEVFCTCPYYDTMQTTCKHIVAALKQRQAELDEGDVFTDENDKIALALCNEYSDMPERILIRASFALFITTENNSYSMTVSLPDYGGEIHGLENFLDCYLNYRDYKIDRNTVYNRKTMYFPEKEDRIISALAEVYETKSVETVMYQKSIYQTSFGATVLKRILPMLSKMDFKIIIDGITLHGVRIIQDDPDIVVDVNTFGSEIVLSVSEYGRALTPDGEWFFHNDTIYKTSEQWRRFFMPIYKAISAEGRTQLSFKGDNTIMFAANVLPVLKDRRDVVINGIDDIIVNDKPFFEVCLDSSENMITAVILVSYGNIKFRLPTDEKGGGNKIVLRDYRQEDIVLSFFDDFVREKSFFSLNGDVSIYNFITDKLDDISKYAQIIMSDNFKNMKIKDDFDISVNASYRNDIDFLEISFDTELSSEELKSILEAIRLKKDFFRRSDGSYIELRKNKKQDILNFLERLDLSVEDILSKSKILPKYHMLYIDSSGKISKDGSIKKYMDKIRTIDAKIPDELKGILRPYQAEGVKWLTQLSSMGMGGILADDMGLGKTLQVIAYIHGIKPDKPTLIVAPSTLTYNWLREIDKFTTDVKAIIISGNKDERKEQIERVYDYEFVITSYPLLRRDITEYKNIEFSYCFIDEAQYIKNHKTLNAVSVKKIRAEHKFALTGTPIENSLMELWSIFDFCLHGYLKSSREFREKYEIPAMKDRDLSSAESLRSVIKPFVLRRMKNDVLDELPEKIETTMYADLSKDQKAIYTAYLMSVKEEAAGIINERGSRFAILTLLLRLRQICCHPVLFDDEYTGGSGKLELLMELIKNSSESGHRLLVFSQFRSMLDIVAKELERDKIDYYYINGATPVNERTEMAEKFNAGYATVFLVSLKAGGTGLNLIGADTVVHYDPWWNPAVMDQATDRAYRIGQTRAVQVIKLAARGTIEEKILKLQESKRILADDIIRVNTETFSELTDDEILSLFEL